MKTERGSYAFPVLLGMALSLLVLLLVVNRSEAANQCDLCWRNADIKAQKDCGGTGGPGSDYYKAYYRYRQQDCLCPGCPCTGNGGGTITGTADCGSDGCKMVQVSDCGDGADPAAGSVCDNSCWAKTCSTGTGQCADISANAPKSALSLCHVQCGCK